MNEDLRLRRLVRESVEEALGRSSASKVDGLVQIVRPMVTSVRSVLQKIREGNLLDNEVGQFCMYCQRFDEMYRRLCREYNGSEE